MNINTNATIAGGIMVYVSGLLGPVAADIAMVVGASLVGVLVATQESKLKGLLILKNAVIGILTALALSWGISHIVLYVSPSLNTPYLPSIFAFIIGLKNETLSKTFNSVLSKFKYPDKGEK